jgi:hypothetical protein
VPAVCGLEALAVNDAAFPGLTTIEPVVPLIGVLCSVAVIVVVSALTSVTLAVPAPLEKLTDPGYVGAVLFGEFDGPEKSIVFEPV